MEIWKLFAWYEYDSLFCRNKHITKAIVITASPQSQWPLANIIVGLHTDWRWLLEIEWTSQLFNLRQTFFAPDSGIRTSATKWPGSGHKRFSSHKYFSVANIFLWTLGWDRQLTGAQQVKTENCRDSWLTFWLLSHLAADTSSSSPWFYSNECGG